MLMYLSLSWLGCIPVAVLHVRPVAHGTPDLAFALGVKGVPGLDHVNHKVLKVDGVHVGLASRDVAVPKNILVKKPYIKC